MNRQNDFFIFDRQVYFPREGYIPQGEFDHSRLLINMFQKTVTQLTMDLHGRAYDGIGLRVALIDSLHDFYLRNLLNLRIYFLPFFPFSSSTRPKIMRPAAVWRTLVMFTSMYSPMYSRPFSTTTIVPSSM